MHTACCEVALLVVGVAAPLARWLDAWHLISHPAVNTVGDGKHQHGMRPHLPIFSPLVLQWTRLAMATSTLCTS